MSRKRDRQARPPRKSFRERAKDFGQKIRTGVNSGVDEYNQVIDKIKEPEVAVGMTQQTMIFIGVALVAFLMFFKRK